MAFSGDLFERGALTVMKPIGLLRRISHACVARLASAIGVTRNQAISARFAFGVLAALLLTLGPAWFSAAAGLLLIGIVLERCDDEFARLSRQHSPRSDHYALVSASLCNALAFVSLGIGMRDSELGLAAVVMGLFAGFAVVLVPWLVRRLEVIDGRCSNEFATSAGLDAADVLLLVPFAIWAGWAEGLLIVAGYGVPTFASALYLTHYRKFTSK